MQKEHISFKISKTENWKVKKFMNFLEGLQQLQEVGNG